ncbi:SMI1/KNR4 family protein [Streptomyces lavendulae]|uniref:hypothetical protein n=1 Tax=Streptomyces lavendulae TaxID=1914 RepID=UPI00380962E4
MEMREAVAAVVSLGIEEHSEAPWRSLPPQGHPAAMQTQILELERLCGQPLEDSYREFLEITDGLDRFCIGLSVLGSREWPGGARAVAAADFGETLTDIGILADVGLRGDVELFPVAIDEDMTVAIFMINSSEVPERFWWVGNGDSMFFLRFLDIFMYVLDPSAYSPRSEIG